MNIIKGKTIVKHERTLRRRLSKLKHQKINAFCLLLKTQINHLNLDFIFCHQGKNLLQGCP
ncbi:CLUMA_CG013302, isoform A [Clunio marinus]|uniref:CLUMA_CG013302, isoform A n=1 Tax=Clunio marinus TaxID=568069 RepID=A0A1J1IKE5_9DIPT|nr:CLUMA_CG013302, isoform A [Clunio marinus]